VSRDWWKDDQWYQRGVEIAMDVKTGGGRYRRVGDELRCQRCVAAGNRKARLILAFYVGPHGQVWVWTAGYRGIVDRGPSDGPLKAEEIPPRALLHAVGLAGVAVCRDCSHGQRFLCEPDGVNVSFVPVPPTYARVVE
jgi:hypothetical protein